jgi:hypothetical protein
MATTGMPMGTLSTEATDACVAGSVVKPMRGYCLSRRQGG